MPLASKTIKNLKPASGCPAPECSPDKCPPCKGVKITHMVSGVPTLITPDNFTVNTVLGYDCCCIKPGIIFPYVGSGLDSCSIQFVHPYGPATVEIADTEFTKFVIASNPRFDSTLEINGVEQVNQNIGSGCSLIPNPSPPPFLISDGVDCFTLLLATDTEYPYTSPMTLNVFDYCKIVSGIGGGYDGGSPSEDGLFCFCKVPPP